MYEAILSENSINSLIDEEERLFFERTPQSRQLFNQGQTGGFWHAVPMPWMIEWNLPNPLYIDSAKDVSVIDVDGNNYVDFCLGDTGAMFGHSPDRIVEAAAKGLENGITTMMPHAGFFEVAENLRDRFDLPFWQTSMTASDANRFVIRISRALTGRPKVLVVRYCYHGSVDEAMVKSANGKVVPRAKWNVNPGIDPAQISRVVEFNDFDEIERELAYEDVALVMMEPVMTNCGMVLPANGYLEHVRELCDRHGSYFLVDETHTFSTGYGGYSRFAGLRPDFLVVGKSIAGGIPIATYGFTEEIAQRMDESFAFEFQTSQMGIGGTLTGNAFALNAMKACLLEVATKPAFEHMLAMCNLVVDGLENAILEAQLPWSVTQCGARCELQFMPGTPISGSQSHDAMDWTLTNYSHLYLINRDVIITPFHNMMLCSPVTTEIDVNKLVTAYSQWMGLVREQVDLRERSS